MGETNEIHVVTWQWADFGSTEDACGVVAAYEALADAERMLKILRDHGDLSKRFAIRNAEMIGL